MLGAADCNTLLHRDSTTRVVMPSALSRVSTKEHVINGIDNMNGGRDGHVLAYSTKIDGLLVTRIYTLFPRFAIFPREFSNFSRDSIKYVNSISKETMTERLTKQISVNKRRYRFKLPRASRDYHK